MQISVFVERMPNNGFRASGAAPFAVSAEGITRAEALTNLSDQIQARLRNGGEVVTLEISSSAHPLAKYSGMFKDDDALIGDWEKSMADYRRKIDEGPETL